MQSTLIFLLGFGLAKAAADTSEYAEVARKAMAEEREEARAAVAEDAGIAAGFDSQLQAATGELNGIMSGVGKPEAPHVAASSPTTVASGDVVDTSDSDTFFAPEDAMRLHLAQLQSKLQASDSISQKLRGAVLDRDHEIHQAEALMKKELAALQTTVNAKTQNAAEVKQLEAQQASLQEHINQAKSSFKSTESQAHEEELKRVSTGSDAVKLHQAVSAANEAEAADEKKMAQFKEQSGADDAQATSKITKLQSIITSMQSEVAGGIAAHVRWEKNATALTQKLQEAKATLRSMLVAKQSSDVDLSQVVSRWKDSLGQLRNHVKMNAELQSRVQQDGQSVVDHMNDLKNQVHERDMRIAQLKRRLAEH